MPDANKLASDSATLTERAECRRWDLPIDLTAFCGPQDLARAVESFRAWEDEGVRRDSVLMALNAGTRGPINGRVLQDLLSVAYQASFLKDEGRYIRGRLFLPGSREPGPRKIVPFSSPLPLTEANMLRLLGPILISPDSALSLTVTGESVFCDGVFLMSENDVDVPIPDVSLRRMGGHQGLTVSILDPGELVISEGILRLDLRATRIVDERDVAFAPLVYHWLEQCMGQVYQRCQEKDGPGMKALNFAPIQEVNWLWSKVLSSARDLKHGGCFVIVESPSPMIQTKFRTERLCIGDQLGEYWLACARAAVLKDQEGFADAVQECNRMRHVLLSSIQALAGLSATDGCVTLDKNLNVLGFGGIISITPDMPTPTRTLANHETRDPIDEQALIAKSGTRHKSAFQLCKYHEGSIAFVISQDGGIRIFASDKDNVYTTGALTV
jgi:hypothetical protein